MVQIIVAVIETHGPYLHGSGFTTVNSNGKFEPFDPNIPPALAGQNTPLGLFQPGVFASEFGVSVFSSYESMWPTLSDSQRYAHSDEMYQRNYCQDSIIWTYFGVSPYNNTTQTDFQVWVILF